MLVGRQKELLLCVGTVGGVCVGRVCVGGVLWAGHSDEDIEPSTGDLAFFHPKTCHNLSLRGG